MTDTPQDNLNAMSTQKAYLLLFLGLFAVYLLIRPAIAQLVRQQQQITALTAQQQQAKQRRNSLAKQRHATTLSLKAMTERGELSPHTLPAKVAENTQRVFKSAARLADASIQQLRPSETSSNSFLDEHSLDVTYTINSSKAGLLLTKIANSYPTPRIKMLLLRTQQFGSAKVKSDKMLAGQLILSQTALKKDSLPANKQTEILGEYKTTKLNRAAGKHTAQLESLFDANLRTRERSPSLEYYRLSAITINASTRSVLITDNANGKSRRLIVDDTIAGWRLSEIKPQSITLTKGDESTLLNLE